MKKMFCLILVLACMFTVTGCGQNEYPAKITFKIVDSDGVPIEGGNFQVSTFSHWVPGEGFGRDVNDVYNVAIDGEGFVVFDAGSVDGSFTYAAEPAGDFYPGWGGRYKFNEVEFGRWVPWNPEVVVVVPRIGNPIPLYTRKTDSIELPEKGPVGFDLMVSDWVAPYGKGAVADFVFEVKTIVPMVSPTEPFESVLTMSFSNEGDGIQSVFASPTERLFKLPREAPLDRYDPVLTRKFARTSGNSFIGMNLREDQNYFFRVRTVLDSEGNVVRALYGKIYGNISWDTLNSPSGHLQFTYYLNPTPNDRNLEFDVKQNLFPKRTPGTYGRQP